MCLLKLHFVILRFHFVLDPVLLWPDIRGDDIVTSPHWTVGTPGLLQWLSLCCFKIQGGQPGKHFWSALA